MRDFRDAKAMAQTLREALKTKSISVTHSESLELVAKILGFHDWNVLAARIAAEDEGKDIIPARGIPATGEPLVAPKGHLPVMAMRDLVFFPQMTAPLYVGRDTTKRALECAMASDRRILVLTQRRSADDNPTAADLYGVGVTSTIVELVNLANGTIKVLTSGIERASVARLAEGRFLSAETAPFEEHHGGGEEAAALSRTLLEGLKALRMVNFLPSPSPYDRLWSIEQPAALADAVAALLKCEISQKQDLLETGDVVARLQKILALMKAGQQAA
jgi:ATP-dependent Lon protease